MFPSLPEYSIFCLLIKVGVDGITYAGNHGLEIMHPDGHVYSHSIPQDYRQDI